MAFSLAKCHFTVGRAESSDCESISYDTDSEELSPEQQELIDRVRAKKPTNGLPNAALVQKKVGKFLVDTIDISIVSESSPHTPGCLKKEEDLWCGQLKRVSFRGHVEYIESSSVKDIVKSEASDGVDDHVFKEEVVSETNLEHNLPAVRSNEAYECYSNSGVAHYSGLRLNSNVNPDEDIHWRSYEDFTEHNVHVPRASAASGSAMRLMAIEEKKKRRRICRKLETDDVVDEKLPFYPHDSYSQLGEARRRVSSMEICVPLQNSAVATHVGFKNLVVKAAEINFKNSTKTASQKFKSISKSNERYQMEVKQLRQSISQMKKEAAINLDATNVVLQATSRKNLHQRVHGRLRSQLAGTNPLQLFLPDGCDSVPNSWFQYSPFVGVALYSTRDATTREATALINGILNCPTNDSSNDAEKAVIRLVKEKMENPRGRTIRKTVIRKPTVHQKNLPGSTVIPLHNRFARYAAEHCSVSTAMGRQMTSRENAEHLTDADKWVNIIGSRKEPAAFIQPSRVHFDLELVKSWKMENEEYGQHKLATHGNCERQGWSNVHEPHEPGSSGRLEPVQSQRYSSQNSFTMLEYPIDDMPQQTKEDKLDLDSINVQVLFDNFIGS